jgi:alpha-tubulin suppressor-like RCC1 family protein
MAGLLALSGLLAAGGGLGTSAAAAAARLTTGTAVAAANGAVGWGDDSAGQLGNGTVTQSATPTAVGNLSGIKAIATGDRFTLALLSNGTLEAWGTTPTGSSATALPPPAMCRCR